MNKISIIGYRNQALKLRTIVKQKNCTIDWIYHPTKSEFENSTNELKNIYDSDAIIIASPNETHYNYIEKILENYSGYIFCEKPPVTTNEELIQLQNISKVNKQRIFFNFNLRFGDINNGIENALREGHIGEIIDINIISSKGYAFKEEYQNSWRSNGKKNLHNILDSVTIHFIDLLNIFLKEVLEYDYQPKLISMRGTAFDTIKLNLKYEKEISVSILNSYAAPFYNELTIVGTNGILTFSNNKMIILSPRNTFDEKGFFKIPPERVSKPFNFEQEFSKSTENIIDYFLQVVNKKGSFNTKYFDASVKTTKMILDIKANYGKDF